MDGGREGVRKGGRAGGREEGFGGGGRQQTLWHAGEFVVSLEGCWR